MGKKGRERKLKKEKERIREVKRRTNKRNRKLSNKLFLKRGNAEPQEEKKLQKHNNVSLGGCTISSAELFIFYFAA